MTDEGRPQKRPEDPTDEQNAEEISPASAEGTPLEEEVEETVEGEEEVPEPVPPGERVGRSTAPAGVSDRPPPNEAPTDIASALKIEAPRAHPIADIRPVPDERHTSPMTEEAEPEGDLLVSLLEGFEEAHLESSHGQEVVRLPRERLREFAEAAKEAGFEVCTDVTAVDWYRQRRARFELVINLLSHRHRRRLRLLVPVPGDDPRVDSVTPLWQGANFAERETYDMFGIAFEGHPDLTRILMPDDWVGHPLRKDFAVGSVPVQFKGSHEVR